MISIVLQIIILKCYKIQHSVILGSKNVMELIVESFAHVGNAMCVKFNPQVFFYTNDSQYVWVFGILIL